MKITIEQPSLENMPQFEIQIEPNMVEKPTVKLSKFANKLALGIALAIWLPCFGCYMLCYELWTWRFWHSAKCVTIAYKDGAWTKSES